MGGGLGLGSALTPSLHSLLEAAATLPVASHRSAPTASPPMGAGC